MVLADPRHSSQLHVGSQAGNDNSLPGDKHPSTNNTMHPPGIKNSSKPLHHSVEIGVVEESLKTAAELGISARDLFSRHVDKVVSQATAQRQINPEPLLPNSHLEEGQVVSEVGISTLQFFNSSVNKCDLEQLWGPTSQQWRTTLPEPDRTPISPKPPQTGSEESAHQATGGQAGAATVNNPPATTTDSTESDHSTPATLSSYKNKLRSQTSRPQGLKHNPFQPRKAGLHSRFNRPGRPSTHPASTGRGPRTRLRARRQSSTLIPPHPLRGQKVLGGRGEITFHHRSFTQAGPDNPSTPGPTSSPPQEETTIQSALPPHHDAETPVSLHTSIHVSTEGGTSHHDLSGDNIIDDNAMSLNKVNNIQVPEGDKIIDDYAIMNKVNIIRVDQTDVPTPHHTPTQAPTNPDLHSPHLVGGLGFHENGTIRDNVDRTGVMNMDVLYTPHPNFIDHLPGAGTHVQPSHRVSVHTVHTHPRGGDNYNVDTQDRDPTFEAPSRCPSPDVSSPLITLTQTPPPQGGPGATLDTTLTTQGAVGNDNTREGTLNLRPHLDIPPWMFPALISP